MIQKIADRFGGGQGGNRVGKALAIVFVALVAFSVVAPFLGGLAVVEPDHDGVAAADSHYPTENWTYNAPTTPVGIGADESTGESYVINSTGSGVIALNPDGTVKWESNTGGASNRDIAVNSETQDIYVLDGNGDVHNLDYQGNVEWSYSTLGDAGGVAVDEGNNTIYATGYTNEEFHAINGDGTQKWSKTLTGLYPNGVEVDQSTGDVYLADAGAGQILAYHPDGTQKWAYDDASMGQINAIGVDEESGTIAGAYGELVAVDTSGSKLWNYTGLGAAVEEGALKGDSVNGTFYVGTKSTEGHVHAVANDGSLRWEYTGEAGNEIHTIGNNEDKGTIYVGSGSQKAIEVEAHGGVTESTSGPSSSTGSKQSIGLVEDELGMFPPGDSELAVHHRTTEYKPLWQVEGDSVEDWHTYSWEVTETSSFNWENRTSVTLEDGEYYRLELHSTHGTWEDSGFQYDASEYSGSTIWLAPDTGHLDDNDDGTAGGDSSSGTNGPGDSDGDDGSDDGSGEEDQGFGPTALSSCSTPDGQDGVEVEYWDPDYETWELEGNLSIDGETTYYVHKEFSDARGYYRGCLADVMTNNGSDSRDKSWNHTARNASGALVSDGSTSWSPPVFGPTGNAPSSTGERVGLLGGVLGALAVLWFGGNRYVPASSVPSWPSESINPAFGVGAPIVAVLGLDLAGGGVISASVATGLAQIAPFAGIVGVTVGGYAVLRWIRAPQS